MVNNSIPQLTLPNAAKVLPTGNCQLPTRRWLLVIFPVARLEKNG
jgi:hypothetical protein